MKAYRPEIDGLRAVAVIPVILFHAGFSIFSGGFIGVDVFFVISGYLITSIILNEKQAGTFTLLNFYERRARRILPALFTVLAVTYIFAWAWLLPDAMKNFSQSLASVIIFASNFLFWRETGYFDVSSELKPLLHTWSLAVEEQYYLLFPVFIIATWKLGLKIILSLLAIVCIVSLAFSEIALTNAASSSFFLLPYRAWELLLGVFAAFYLSSNPIDSKNKNSLNQILSLVGILFIAWPIFYYTNKTPFPGLNALAPTIGSVLIILFCTPATYVGKALCSKLFVGIGLVSYSAYLWHQPLFALARHKKFEELSSIELLILSVLSFILAYISWRFIETPFRKKDKTSRLTIFSFAIIGSIFFMGLGVMGHLKGGFENRFDWPTDIVDSYDYSPRAKECFDRDNVHTRDDWFCDLYNDGSTPQFLVFGDSHSLSLLDLFTDIATEKKVPGVFAGINSCVALLNVHSLHDKQHLRNCNQLNARVLQYAIEKKIQTVFLVSRWTFYTEGGYKGDDFSYISTTENGDASKEESRRAFEIGLKSTIEAYKEAGINVYFVEQVPEQLHPADKVYYHSFEQKDITAEESIQSLSVSREEHEKFQSYVNSQFSLYPEMNIISLEDIYCNETTCPIGSSTEALYFDNNHVSKLGATKAKEVFEKYVQ
ncbi:MAG: acyltransferase [Cellvibrionaceae bacterium]